MPGAKVSCSGHSCDWQLGQTAAGAAAACGRAGPGPHQPRAQADGPGHHRGAHRWNPPEIYKERGETLGHTSTDCGDASVWDNLLWLCLFLGH